MGKNNCEPFANHHTTTSIVAPGYQPLLCFLRDGGGKKKYTSVPITSCRPRRGTSFYPAGCSFNKNPVIEHRLSLLGGPSSNHRTLSNPSLIAKEIHITQQNQLDSNIAHNSLITTPLSAHQANCDEHQPSIQHCRCRTQELGHLTTVERRTEYSSRTFPATGYRRTLRESTSGPNVSRDSRASSRCYGSNEPMQKHAGISQQRAPSKHHVPHLPLPSR